MSLPTATYRLQFRGGMDFDRAAGIVPYLARLGISHLYASPLAQAMPGSSHGYDVTDHNRFDESLGGMAGFLRLTSALAAYGMELILDIVPNHMAASVHNPWWRDVLRHGRDSAFAGHFDIDWSAPKLVLPTLGQPYGATLEAGEFALGHDDVGLVWRYLEHPFPLDPRSWELVLGSAGIGFPEGSPAEAAERFASWIGDSVNAARLDDRLEALSRDTVLLHRVHEAQPWRLAYWRAARDALTYRRFFEIADLVGVRVEDERVFDDVHRLLFEMLATGHIHGLRVDHVDGLADPADYLDRLKEKAPGHPPIWVEKILAPGEPLPADWPVAGTTGYEVARLLGGLLTDPQGTGELTAAYEDFAGGPRDIEAMLADAKRQILTVNLAAEVGRLTELVAVAAADDAIARDWGPDTLKRALIAVTVAMPVYRTYLAADGAGEAETALLDRVERDATAWADLDDPTAVHDVVRLIRTAPGETGSRLRARFEQTTGALMAKAKEDTLFYRYNRLISANEVGSDAHPIGLAPAMFAREIVERSERQPHGLNATATHDTKRGEDARARIAAIADAPETWREAVGGWDRLLDGADEFSPEPEMRWVFYQALLGAWAPQDLSGLAERMAAYMVKAAREAKQATSWTRRNTAYEQTLTDFVRRALADGTAFAEKFEERARPFIIAGERKSLVQLALKLVLPGIPDIYQGTEWADLSLVDPDNRRPVDFPARSAALGDPALPIGSFDRTKMALMHRLLGLRRGAPSLFEEGDTAWLKPGPSPSGRYFGCARAHGDAVLILLSELSAGRGDAAPGFALPKDWQSIEFGPVFPQVSIIRSDNIVSPQDGFDCTPVVVALGRR